MFGWHHQETKILIGKGIQADIFTWKQNLNNLVFIRKLEETKFYKPKESTKLGNETYTVLKKRSNQDHRKIYMFPSAICGKWLHTEKSRPTNIQPDTWCLMC